MLGAWILCKHFFSALCEHRSRMKPLLVCFMKENAQHRAIGINCTESVVVLLYNRGSEHMFTCHIGARLSLMGDVSIECMSWTCDGLFLNIVLSDGSLVLLTNCGDLVQMYVKENVGQAMERKRINTFKRTQATYLFHLPQDKTLDNIQTKGHWITVSHPYKPITLITNGCLLIAIKLPTCNIYNITHSRAVSYNTAVRAMINGLDTEPLPVEGLELMDTNDFLRITFHAWTMILSYPYAWSSHFNDSTRRLFRLLVSHLFGYKGNVVDLLRICSQLLFVYERDAAIAHFLVNELGYFLRVFIRGLVDR